MEYLLEGTLNKATNHLDYFFISRNALVNSKPHKGFGQAQKTPKEGDCRTPSFVKKADEQYLAKVRKLSRKNSRYEHTDNTVVTLKD